MSNKDVKVEECNQVILGLCNCKCYSNGKGPCFIEREYLLKQENKRLREALEEIKGYLIGCEYGLDVKKLVEFIKQALKGEWGNEEIIVDNKGKYIGVFDTFNDAVKVRKLVEHFYWECVPQLKHELQSEVKELFNV